jgi:DUF1680 family protein
MRGGEGLARAIQYSYFQDKDTVVLPFYSNGTATLRFAEGTCKVRQETGYPHKGQARLEVLESQVNKEKPWRFFVPSWAVKDSFEIRVNGKKVEPRLADSFAEIEVPLVAGTVVEVAFHQQRGPRPAVQAEMAKGAARYFDGPLLLGATTENADEPLVPILDLLAVGGSGGEVTTGRECRNHSKSREPCGRGSGFPARYGRRQSAGRSRQIVWRAQT